MGRFSLYHNVFLAEALFQVAHKRGVQVAGRADELAAVLDEKGAGAEILAVDVDAVIMEMIVHTLIALVPENTQGHIGQRRTELSAADVTVGDGDDLFSL